MSHGTTLRCESPGLMVLIFHLSVMMSVSLPLGLPLLPSTLRLSPGAPTLDSGFNLSPDSHCIEWAPTNPLCPHPPYSFSHTDFPTALRMSVTSFTCSVRDSGLSIGPILLVTSQHCLPSFPGTMNTSSCPRVLTGPLISLDVTLYYSSFLLELPTGNVDFFSWIFFF